MRILTALTQVAIWRTAAPPGLRFEHYPDESMPGAGALNAFIGDRHAGQISWEPDGEIGGLSVFDPELQRKGIATAMYNHAKTLHPNLHHVDESAQTDAGKAWIKSLGES